MKKGEVTIGHVVKYMLMAIGLGLVVFLIFPGVVDFLLSAGDILETETVPVVVDKGMLERSANSVVFYKGKTYKNVQIMLDKFMDMHEDSPENYLAKTYYDPYYENSKYRWAFAKIVADRLFECSLKTTFKAEQLSEILAITETGPTDCIVCYNIHIAPDARELLWQPDREIIGNFGFGHWLYLFSPKKQKESYYELIIAGYRFPEGLSQVRTNMAMQKKIDRILIADPEDDIAVVFVHVPLVAGDWGRIPGLIGKSGNVDFVALYSYKKLADTSLISFSRDLAGVDWFVRDIDARCGR
jgi:hypothetical protein